MGWELWMAEWMRGGYEGRTPTTSSAKCKSKVATAGMELSKSSIGGGEGRVDSLNAIHEDNVDACESSMQARRTRGDKGRELEQMAGP